MAGFQHLISFLLLTYLQLSGALIVHKAPSLIIARERDDMVILPCNFTALSGTPNITWFREREGGRIKVMKYANNTLLEYDKFKKRVYRGDHADLFLFKPTVEDSGNYTCEVNVEPETDKPHWGSKEIVLQIKKETVFIPNQPEPIRANVSDCVVILPCKFMTLSEAPRITWYHEKAGGRRKVMTFDNDHLESFDEYHGRVARGDRGALVLLKPKSRDSGRYTCEVQEDTEEPNRANNTVELNITETLTTTATPTSTPSERPSRTPSVIAYIWSALLLVFASILGMVNAIRQVREGVRNKWKMAGKVVQVVAFILICIATFFSAKGLSCESYQDRLTGLFTSLSGMTLLLVMVYLMAKLSNNSPSSNSARTPETTRAFSPNTSTVTTATPLTTATASMSTITTSPTTVTASTSTITTTPTTVTASTSTMTTPTNNVTASPTTTTSLPTTSGASSSIGSPSMHTRTISVSSSDGTSSPSAPVAYIRCPTPPPTQESSKPEGISPNETGQSENSGEHTTGESTDEVHVSCNDPLLPSSHQP